MTEVSVIVPNYNHAAYLQQRVDSILAQTFRDFELILLDDCSADNSRDVLEQYRHHPQVKHVVFNRHNSGTPFRQWQKGLALATGKWVWIAESDDYADPYFLEKMLQTARDAPGAGLVYCGSRWVDEKGQEGKDLSSYSESFYRKGKDEVCEKLWQVCTIQNVSSCMMRREIAVKCIRGLGHYRACGDWMFYIKMLQHTDLAFTGEKLNYFRYYHSNTSNWAEKNGLWITEGVNTLRYINYRRMGLDKKQFRSMARDWYYRAKTLPRRKKYPAMFSIAMSAGRFLLSRI